MSADDRPSVAGVRDLRAADRVVQVAERLVVLAVGGVAEHGSDELDRKSTRLNSSHSGESRMPSSA